MNNKVFPLLILTIFFTSFAPCKGKSIEQIKSLRNEISGKIQISGAFALYPIVVKWAEEFRKLHPKVNFDVSAGGTGKGMTDVLTGMVDIAMISREIHPKEIVNGAFAIVLVKDAVVPIINMNNPDLKRILSIGLKKGVAKQLWSGKIKTWNEALEISVKTSFVHVYTRSDACGAAETWASWFGFKQENLKATAIFGDPGITEAIQKDNLAIGYSNISFVYNKKTRKPFEKLAVVPLDVNENGKIDLKEDFYGTLDNLVHAIKDGRYPSPPARNLYFVTKGKPKNPILIYFLKYVLSGGQKYVDEAGYIALNQKKLDEELTRIK